MELAALAIGRPRHVGNGAGRALQYVDERNSIQPARFTKDARVRGGRYHNNGVRYRRDDGNLQSGVCGRAASASVYRAGSSGSDIGDQQAARHFRLFRLRSEFPFLGGAISKF